MIDLHEQITKKYIFRKASIDFSSLHTIIKLHTNFLASIFKANYKPCINLIESVAYVGRHNFENIFLENNHYLEKVK